MPVGHRKFNATESDPNDAITFIRPLKAFPDRDQAEHILKSLAAQFKPIMKEWGMGVNSLEEAEYNRTFAGRNWNAGEVIEIVLRRPDGSFAPYQFILHVMCHELAHIKEMNHAHGFQKVNAQIRRQLAALRARRYFGDGFYSEGRSLQYEGMERGFAPDEEPMFACGGANKKHRRFRVEAGQRKPSAPRGSAKLGKTGRQTAIAPKAGGRVKRKGAFEGEGNTLSADPDQSTHRRRANAKGAVEARLLAAEERMKKEQKDKQNESKPFKEETIDRKPKVELDSDGEWEDAEPDEIEWTKAEEEWMKDDLAHWNDDALIISGQGAVASGSGLSKEKDKGKGKRRASAESPPDVKPKKIIDLSSDSDVPTKKRKTSSSSSSRASGSSKKPMEVIDLSSDSD